MCEPHLLIEKSGKIYYSNFCHELSHLMRKVGLMLTSEEVQTLMQLGLTSCQARIYIALAKSDMLTSKELSKLTGITQQDVYRVIPSLHERGLIEKILENPVKYRALSIGRAVAILLDRRKHEIRELKNKTKHLIQNAELNKKTTLPKHDSNFIIIPPNEFLISKLANSINKVETQIDIVTLSSRLQEATDIFKKIIKNSLKKGIKIRLILVQEKQHSIQNIPQVLINDNTEIKHSFLGSRTLMVIYDEKEVYIFTKESSKIKESPALWSNAPALVNLAQQNFETLWKKSKKIKHFT
jgi:sugar-specific transcriptional regulator TrmB